MRFILLIFIIFNLCFASAQTSGYIKYFQSVDSAEYRMFVGDYDIAEKIYLKAFSKVVRPLELDCYMLARCMAKNGQYDSAIVYLEKSTTTFIGTNRTFKVVLQDQYYFRDLLSYDNDLYARLEKMDSVNEVLFQNDSVVKRISRFMTDIYTIRKKNEDTFWDSIKFHNDTANPVYKKHHRIARQNNDALMLNIIDFIKQNGYPGLLTWGSDFLKLYLTGMTDEMYKDLKPFLVKELDEGRMMPYEFEDIIWWFECKDRKLCCRYPNESCTESDWEFIIKQRQEIGASMFFKYPNRNILGEKELFPWVGTLVK